MCLVGVWENDPVAWAALRKELGNTYPTMENIDSFPLLDSFFYELERCFMRPAFKFMRAKRDFNMPAGDGNRYRIREGEIVQAYFGMALRDPTVFSNPEEFDAWRFINNPELKKKVWMFGHVEGSKYFNGCAAYLSGFAGKQHKLILAHFLQRVNFQLNGKPDIKGDYISVYHPLDIKFSHFRLRHIDYDQH